MNEYDLWHYCWECEKKGWHKETVDFKGKEITICEKCKVTREL